MFGPHKCRRYLCTATRTNTRFSLLIEESRCLLSRGLRLIWKCCHGATSLPTNIRYIALVTGSLVNSVHPTTDMSMRLISVLMLWFGFYDLYLALKLPCHFFSSKKRCEQRRKRQISAMIIITTSIRPKCQPPPGVRELVLWHFSG